MKASCDGLDDLEELLNADGGDTINARPMTEREKREAEELERMLAEID